MLRSAGPALGRCEPLAQGDIGGVIVGLERVGRTCHTAFEVFDAGEAIDATLHQPPIGEVRVGERSAQRFVPHEHVAIDCDDETTRQRMSVGDDRADLLHERNDAVRSIPPMASASSC